VGRAASTDLVLLAMISGTATKFRGCARDHRGGEGDYRLPLCAGAGGFATVLAMSIPVTVLVYVGIPLAIIVAMSAAVYLPSEIKSPARYRVGRPWLHEPSWYLPHQIIAEPSAGPIETHAPAAVLAAPVAHDTKPVGGASGEW
jgi:hypothetical protein